MLTWLPLIVAAVLAANVSTSYYAQGATNLLEAVHVAAVEQAEGRRLDLDAGAPAPFAGVLLDDVALGLLRDEIGLLRDEITALRSALEAQKEVAELEKFRAKLWEAEATPNALTRLIRYGCAASFGLAVGTIATR